MENDLGKSPASIRPPRWADALLRASLTPDEAETLSGDLLEAYRDSVYPSCGAWRANLWFLLQVTDCTLRARGTPLRNWLLGGLTSCASIIVFSLIRYPGFRVPLSTPKNLFIIVMLFLIYAGAILWRTRPRNPEDALVLHLGTRWGLATGAMWVVSTIGGNLVPRGVGVPTAILLVIAAVFSPLIAGAHAGIKTGRVRTGTRVGFWSGLIGGLMAFFALAVVGYVLAFVPGFPGAEIPRSQIYTAEEYESVNVADALDGALAEMFLFGGVISVAGGTIGSCLGILLERTGRGPETSTRL